MDDYLVSPDYDTFETAGSVLVDTGRVEPWVSPENIENYTATRSIGGVG